jgi:gliding motility associated protien GldN
MFNSYKNIVLVATALICGSTAYAQSAYGKQGGTNRVKTTPQNNKPKTNTPTTGSAYGKPTTQPATNATGSAYGNPQPPASSNTGSAYGQPPASNTGSAYGQPPAPVQKQAGLTYTFVENKNGGLGDSVKASLRNDNAIEKQLVKERAPLPYDHIREDDAAYRQKLWIEVDTREKINQVFGYSADEDNGNQRFISILLSALKEDSVTAFSSDDDRFTTPLTYEKAMEKVFGSGGMDTSEKYDLKGNVIGYEVRRKQIEPDSIYKFRIKEEIVFDKEASRLYRRILGIAPIMPRYTILGGKKTKIGDDLLFWIYYPDARKTFAKFEVYNSKNTGARQTWEDFLESHMFTYYIIKSSLNNVGHKDLAKYFKDPLFRLLEGEKIKEKIFNYEQNLWEY